ncbi:MAG: class I SAM-dependent methyltransferase family protein [Archaeoglobus sp.]|uniref:class I SAM-dependent methyltransferase n=1 Tax=Archaeoglobus sp. TaxID=1872626 RepID=UPI001E03E0F6|nr:class I SAM-dependent methyltransferase family protein [Archaeoglobus sp.]MBO8179351.1 class I SAM-dependent methyltransferase family protein [Archaeoglobus sp.]
MKAVRVPKSEAEQVRKLAEKLGVKDKSRRITAFGDYVEIPIVDGAEKFFEGYTIVEQKNPVFSKKKNLKEVLKGKVPEELIPTNYKVIGDIVIVKLDEKAKKYAKAIGEALMQINPCKAVWCDFGRFGMKRKPKMELIAGEGSVTEHKENGCRFRLDVTKVMFSLGNQAERMRVARLVEDGEIVVDMFAGIGYFSIPIAVHSKAKRIYAIEINPDSYHFLLKNMRLNGVENIIPILGDSQFVTPEGVADRVVMGHIYCHDYLYTAIRALRGEGIIHYHESTPEAVIDRPIRRVKKACGKMGKKCEILNFKKVKNYSPGVYHVVVDARVY